MLIKGLFAGLTDPVYFITLLLGNGTRWHNVLRECRMVCWIER